VPFFYKTMFEKNKIYKHKNCLDVVFKVNKILEETNDRTSLLGLWLNKHYSLMIICDDVIDIQKEDIEKWEEFVVE
jgi:hypothetical protein